MGPALYGSAMYKEISIYPAVSALSSRSTGRRRVRSPTENGGQDHADGEHRGAAPGARRAAAAPRIDRWGRARRTYRAGPNRGHDLEVAGGGASLLRARLDRVHVLVVGPGDQRRALVVRGGQCPPVAVVLARDVQHAIALCEA